MEKDLNGYATFDLPKLLLPHAENADDGVISLAMVYAPMQEYRHLYTPDVALARGTIFSELDKPLRLGADKR